MSEEPKDDENEVPIETAESEDDVTLSEDAIDSIVGEAADSGETRDPEEVTADQVDALKEMMGTVGPAEEESESETVDPDDIASILEQAGDESSDESEAPTEEASTPAPEPEEATADQVDALAAMMGNFGNDKSEDSPEETSEEAAASPASEEVEEESEATAESEPETQPEAAAADPEEATADQVDALAAMMGNFGADKPAPETASEENSESADEPEPEAAVQDAEENTAAEPEAPETPEADPEPEATAEPEAAADDSPVDADDIASILAAESPEVEEEPETEEKPETEEAKPEAKVDPGNVAKEEGILTPDILENLILTPPDDKPESDGKAAPAAKVSDEEASKILGDEEIEDAGDDEQISADELASLMDAEAPAKEKESSEAEPEKEPEAVPDDAANIVTPEDDLDEEEELAEEPSEAPKEAEAPKEPEPEAKPKKSKLQLKFPVFSKLVRLFKPLGFVAMVSSIAMVSAFIVIKIAAPKSGADADEHMLRRIPVVGSDYTIRVQDIQPSIDLAIEPYLDNFTINQGWIHAVAHSGDDISVSVSLTATTKQILYEIVDDSVLLNRLVLTPNRFNMLRRELMDDEKSEVPARPAAPADQYIRERFPEGFSTRAVLNFYGKPDGREWVFTEPDWQVADYSGKLPTGFIKDFLGGEAMHIDDPKVGFWVQEYNEAAQTLLDAAQSGTEIANLNALQKRVDNRLTLFSPFEVLSGRMYTPDNLDRGVSFNAIITDVYEDGFFEGYFEMRNLGLDPKRFSGRVALSRGENGSFVQTAHIRTFRESGLESREDGSVPRIFAKGFQDSISLVSEPGFLSGRLDDMYITLAKP
ncbi:MAG: hypothetical protein ACPGN3_05385 [Opitutales bacterium]